MGDARHQGVDVAVEALESLHVTVDPVLGQALAALGEMLEKLSDSAVCSSVMVLRKSGT